MKEEVAKREIESLDYYLQNHTDDYSEESHTAMMMAIDALSSKWIPVSERLPKEDNEVLITIKSCGELYVCHSVYRDGLFWQKNFEFNSYRNPIAWMPLPKPYEPQERSGKG